MSTPERRFSSHTAGQHSAGPASSVQPELVKRGTAQSPPGPVLPRRSPPDAQSRRRGTKDRHQRPSTVPLVLLWFSTQHLLRLCWEYADIRVCHYFSQAEMSPPVSPPSFVPSAGSPRSFGPRSPITGAGDSP